MIVRANNLPNIGQDIEVLVTWFSAESLKSKNKVITKLPVGCSIIANNYFWLHGRKAFKENIELSRELLRIRGRFFN